MAKACRIFNKNKINCIISCFEMFHSAESTIEMFNSIYNGFFINAECGKSSGTTDSIINIISAADINSDYISVAVEIYNNNGVVVFHFLYAFNRKIGLRSFIAAVRANKAAEVTVGVISIIILVLTKDAILSVADFRCFCILIKRNINAESNNFIRDFLRH